MDTHPINESSFQRALQDTMLAFHTVRVWGLFVVWEGVLMIVPSLMESVDIPRLEYGIIQAVVFVVGMISLLLAVFLVQFLYAPYRQRNEARLLLQAQPKPISLPSHKPISIGHIHLAIPATAGTAAAAAIIALLLIYPNSVIFSGEVGYCLSSFSSLNSYSPHVTMPIMELVRRRTNRKPPIIQGPRLPCSISVLSSPIVL